MSNDKTREALAEECRALVMEVYAGKSEFTTTQLRKIGQLLDRLGGYGDAATAQASVPAGWKLVPVELMEQLVACHEDDTCPAVEWARDVLAGTAAEESETLDDENGAHMAADKLACAIAKHLAIPADEWLSGEAFWQKTYEALAATQKPVERDIAEFVSKNFWKMFEDNAAAGTAAPSPDAEDADVEWDDSFLLGADGDGCLTDAGRDLQSRLQDAARYRWAIAQEDNAEQLHAILMCHDGDRAAINDEIDAARSKQEGGND